jgi:Ca-activated chloride channel family protein
MISEFRFEHPGFLWLLLVVPPALVFFFGWAWRQRQKLLSQFIDDRLLAGLTAGFSPVRRKWKLACLVAASACLVVSLARPQWGSHWEEARQRGLDIVVAIDTSKSMLADDIAPNRLERAKLAAFDLMQQARSDRLGIVAFAGAAFLQCPLTSDDGAFKQCLDALNVNIIPEGGTAIAEAITTAQAAFKGDAESYKVLVLFTDGEDQDSGAVEAAKTAAKAGVRIFTVGIGNAEGELLRIKTEDGRTDYVRDADGNVVKSRLNETLLSEIALAASGFYLPMRGAGTIDTLYTQGLALLPKTEGAARLTKRYHERFYWPLLLAIALLIAEMLISERSRKDSATNGFASVARSGDVRAGATALLLCLMATAQASSSGALREYQAGRYDNALKEYRQLLEKRRDDPRLNFNAGDAAYRDGQFEEAAKQFEGALSAKDLQLQQKSYFNRGNTFYQIGDRAQDPQEKQQSWEKAVQDYQSTLKLAPQDADAKHNLEFVKRKIEELKQQQQKQDKNDQKNDDQKKDDQQKDDQKQDQQKKDQKDQSSQNKDSKDSSQQKKQDSSAQDTKDKQNQEKQDQQKKDEQARKQKEQEKKDQEQQSSGDKDKSSEEKGDEESVQARPGQMTSQQARQLLDAMKGEERMMPVQIEKRGASRTLKDW